MKITPKIQICYTSLVFSCKTIIETIGVPEILCTQGRIETGNGSVQTLYLPQKIVTKNEEENGCCLINFSAKD